MKIGDTFVSPTGPNARFPEREMRVVGVYDDTDGNSWVDAEPVRPMDSDQHFHCTYKLDDDGRVLNEPHGTAA